MEVNKTTGTGAGDRSGSTHHSVLSDTDTHQVYLAEQDCYTKLIPSHVSGQSVEAAPQADEESDVDTGQNVPDGVGGCPHYWPEIDVPELTPLTPSSSDPGATRENLLSDLWRRAATFWKGLTSILIGIINLIKNFQVIMDDGHVRP